MSVGDIVRLPVATICAPNAHCWIWVTNNYLPAGLRAMEAWGFRYVTNVAWGKVKRKTGKVQIGIGQYLRGSHELLLFGVRGKLPPQHRGTDIPASVFCSLQLHERTKHSRKPPAIYDTIEAVSGAGPRVELFARDVHPGWHAIGREETLNDKGGFTSDVGSAINALAHDRELLRSLTRR